MPKSANRLVILSLSSQLTEMDSICVPSRNVVSYIMAVVDFMPRDDDDGGDDSTKESVSSCSTAFFCVGRSPSWLGPVIEIMNLLPPILLLLPPRSRDDGDNN
jgi:hypothetical protein